MGKGSRARTLNTPDFNSNYDKIFGAKDERHKRVPQEKGEEYSGQRDTKAKQDETL